MLKKLTVSYLLRLNTVSAFGVLLFSFIKEDNGKFDEDLRPSAGKYLFHLNSFFPKISFLCIY